jgi:hypothetical protein
MEKKVSMFDLSLTAGKLLACPYGREGNATTTEPEGQCLTNLGEQFSSRVIASIGADPVNDAVSNEGSAN